MTERKVNLFVEMIIVTLASGLRRPSLAAFKLCIKALMHGIAISPLGGS